MFRALAEAGINIEMITTSEIRITCIVAEAQVEEAVCRSPLRLRIGRSLATPEQTCISTLIFFTSSQHSDGKIRFEPDIP